MVLKSAIGSCGFPGSREGGTDPRRPPQCLRTEAPSCRTINVRSFSGGGWRWASVWGGQNKHRVLCGGEGERQGRSWPWPLLATPDKQACGLWSTLLLLADLCSRPPVSRAAPQPEKLQKNNITKKKKLVEVRRLNAFAFTWILMF